MLSDALTLSHTKMIHPIPAASFFGELVGLATQTGIVASLL